MQRREFIRFAGSAVAAWPLGARAQQAGRMCRIGILLNASSDDPQYQAWLGAFLQELALLGWAAAATLHRDLIITLAARYKLPAVYSERSFVAAGGLISYGADYIDQYRKAAGYVDRILKGEKPANLPVQVPTKYETVLNLKTAKALGLDVPAIVLTRADEVIE